MRRPRVETSQSGSAKVGLRSRISAWTRPSPAAKASSPDEKVWARARREFNARLHSAAFWIVETVGAAIFGVIAGEASAAAIYLAVVLAVFAAWVVVTTPVIQRDEARRAVREQLASAPRLFFGPIEVPAVSQPIEASVEGRSTPVICGNGGIIRIPVGNARGAGGARRVHASLRFMPREPHDGLWPSPTQAEWFGSGDYEIEIPGNGASHLLNVAVVLDDGYPPVHEWTPRSRATGLKGYEVWAMPVDIEVTVAGVNADPLTDVIRIEVSDSAAAIFAHWLNGVGPEGTTMAAWERSKGRLAL